MTSYPGKISEQFFKRYMELFLYFPQTVSKLGWLHSTKLTNQNTKKTLCYNTINNQLTYHRYDSSSFIAANINLPTAAVTFDQPLYVKAYETVSTKNMNMFVRPGGFN